MTKMTDQVVDSCSVGSPSSRRSWQFEMVSIFVSILLVGVIVKLLYIFAMTRRGIAKIWPYDSYLFEPFHRFTDWLIPWRWAQESNPWDISGELAKMIPPAPYGPGTFWYINITKSIGPTASFFLLIVIFLLVCHVSYKIIASNSPILRRRPLWFMTVAGCLVGFYPVHFLIDRGNADIIGEIFVAAVFLCFLLPEEKFKYVKRATCIDIFIVLAICSKPTWMPIIVVSFLGLSPVRIFRVLAAILILYSIPIIFQGVKYTHYLESARSALDIIGGTVVFSNHLYTVVSAVGRVFPNLAGDFRVALILFGVLYSAFSVLYYFSVRSRVRSDWSRLQVDGLFFGHVLLLVLLFNMPSPDYRLPVLLPFIIFLIASKFTSENASRTSEHGYRSFVKRLVILIAITCSWLGFYSGSAFPIFSPIRALCLLTCDILILAFISQTISTRNKHKSVV